MRPILIEMLTEKSSKIESKKSEHSDIIYEIRTWLMSKTKSWLRERERINNKILLCIH